MERDEKQAFEAVWARVTGRTETAALPPVPRRDGLAALIADAEADEAFCRAAAARAGRSRAGALFAALAAEDRRLLRALRARRYLHQGDPGPVTAPPAAPRMGTLPALREACLRREALSSRLAEAAKDSEPRTARLLLEEAARAEERVSQLMALIEAMIG